jgi:adenosylhomocysteine nucleosidase
LSALGIVTALAAESRTLGRLTPAGTLIATLSDGTRVTVTGMGPAAAAEGARRLLVSGARALMSWGMAGGLDPALRAGTLVLPREVISAQGERFETAAPWRASLARAVAVAMRALTEGALLSCPAPLGSPADKAAAFRSSAAVAVDMESDAVAAVAARERVPFLAVRAIVDTAHEALPPAVTAAAGSDGTLRGHRVIGALLHAPGEVAALMRLAWAYRAARRSLIIAARSGALAPPTAARPGVALA